MHPLVLPNQGGSTLFVYHANAVDGRDVTEMRETVVRTARMNEGAPKRARLVDLWNKIAGLQLGATLKYLAPANDIGLFAVTVDTTSSSAAAGRRMAM
jgi:hypothetical protein